jgi:diadenosine tetraphosphate (Ap4A) HIT family hydrolase
MRLVSAQTSRKAARGLEPQDFILDARLEHDSLPVLTIGLSVLRLMNDARWPWLVLVPQRANIREIFELTSLDQALLSFETTLVSEMLAGLSQCHKINVGALGNVVEQLHVHVVARNPGDPNWPRPVWGHGAREPYDEATASHLIQKIRQAF